ncbi:MAG TPA: Ig-like domain-containing protein, partial [Ohtaekwangia sp.]
PVAVADSYTTNEDAPLSVLVPGVLSNDTDVDNVSFTAVLNTTTSNGTITLNANGSFTYTPAAEFNGSDSFTYHVTDGTLSSAVVTVTITVNLVNDLPVAANDNATTDEDTPLTIDVVANDTDIDSNVDPASVAIVGNPANGSVTVDAVSGEITYTPAADFNGNDSFTYTVEDESNGTSNTATVNITVTPVNDAPDVLADAAETTEGTAVLIDILANDSDIDDVIDATSVTIVSPPANGTFTVDPVSGEVTYTPDAGYLGTDSFTYTVEDASGAISVIITVSILVEPVNDPPLAVDDGPLTYAGVVPFTIDVLQNDSDPDNTNDELTIVSVSTPTQGSVAIVNNEIVFTPSGNTSGTIIFTYTIQDPEGLTDEATVTIQYTYLSLAVSQGFSPDSQGINDTWYIQSIEAYPDNSVKVFDRWGLLVYQAKHYDNVSVVWDGHANTGQESGKQLEQGTYYYVIDLGGSNKTQNGYVMIVR